MDDSSEELAAFLAETDEGLETLDADFVTLENTPRDRDALSRAFRVLHTIKGTSSFFDLKKIETLSHAGESLLARLRDGVLELDPARATLLLRAVDCLREMVVSVKEHGNDHQAAEPLKLIAALNGAAEVAAVSGGGRSAAAGSVPAADARVELDRAAAAGLAETSIRVDLWRIDRFMNMAGELVLIRNRIAQQLLEGQVPSQETLQRLGSVTTQIQDGVLQVRMQPIGKLWRNLPRVVRDLAASLGKDVELSTQGGDTELDRAVIETVRDPLVHAVRNALDHGIESAQARVQAGKPARGHLVLRAWHEAGLVHIAVEDDGAGIDLERVRRKAIERQLLEASRNATDEELIELLFQPGFSTAEAVTSVSGRGVGMDVVRSALERVGGSVQLSSQPGQGTRLVMTMPLTLAIISALIVHCAGERYALPRSSIEEVVRVDAAESFQGTPVLRLRGALVPLVDLASLIRGQPSSPQALCGTTVIVGGEGRSYGLRVDEVLDIQEIVVKPVPKWLRSARAFGGLTILGDGCVALILDVAALGRRARITGSAIRRDAEPAADSHPSGAALELDEVIVVGDGRGGRQAVCLREITRIEQIPQAAVQQLDGRRVVEYRGAVLHLIDVAPWAPACDPMSVLVARVEHLRVGLVVHRVLDVAPCTACEGTSREGMPVVRVNGQMAALQDLSALLAGAGLAAGSALRSASGAVA